MPSDKALTIAVVRAITGRRSQLSSLWCGTIGEGGMITWVPATKSTLHLAGRSVNSGAKATPYGFRVPLLVVSAYTQDGTVSGACGGMGQVPCPNNVFPYQHDFGSLLAFIEYNFFGSDYIGQINPGYPFADAYAPE